MTATTARDTTVPLQRRSDATFILPRIVERPVPARYTGNIVAVVPAYNEAAGIAATVRALKAQWSPPIRRVIVVPNNCTDATADVAHAAGAEVWEYPGTNPHKKAGALNWAIAQLVDELDADDMVLVTDADSTLHPDFTQHAARVLSRPRAGQRWRRPVGAVCAVCTTPDGGRGWLWRLQRNEYARFTGTIARRRGRVNVLSGVATLFKVGVLRRILAGRGATLPGYPGELYHRDSVTEDMELTLTIRSLGYRTVAAPKAYASTDLMGSWGAIREQRLRWQRGMLDSLKTHGFRRYTLGTWARQVVMYAGTLLTPAYLAFVAAAWLAGADLAFDARWMLVGAPILFERLWSVRRGGLLDVLVAALIIPEWAYEQFRAFVYWSALWKTVRGADRVWINN